MIGKPLHIDTKTCIWPDQYVYYKQNTNITHLWCNLTRLSLDQQIPKLISQLLNLRIKVHSLTEDGSAIIGQESVLSKDGCGIGWIAKRNGEGRASGDVVDCGSVGVTHVIDGDFDIGFGAVVELILYLTKRHRGVSVLCKSICLAKNTTNSERASRSII